ncbi:PREDICTED: acylphosphatase-1 isoform X1 [Condylura cristata]|uniref:acylphosphatase-1 isoform X1 n=2 Tax=Condylura cristata TaxID=143302 RepID=UPI00064305FE|nr:PREDICTED: acylphosphatase-1 isoform X1 [Condylura cristata]
MLEEGDPGSPWKSGPREDEGLERVGPAMDGSRAVMGLAGLSMAEGDTLISVDYEVFGKVQGVFFRKYTQAESKKLGLVGWVQNTEQGTVQGQLQGPISKVRHMQDWLRTRGSPKSHIDRANFSNEKVILKLDYSDFQIVK